MTIEIDALNAPSGILKSLKALSTSIEVLAALDKGANGYAFVGWHKILDRKIVVKFYYWGGEHDSYPEPKRLAELDSEYVLKVYDAAPVDSDWAYFTTEYCANGDLDDLISKSPLGCVESIEAISDVLMGIAYLHSSDFVHRDIKPSNIFVQANGRLQIGDFGSVKKMVDGWAENKSAHSLIYRPPETIGAEKYHKAGDIYQAGLVLYQLCGGQFPYQERDWLKGKQQLQYDNISGFIDKQIFAREIIERRIQNGKVLDIDSLPPWVGKSLVSLIRKATSVDVGRRFSSCGQMINALNECRRKNPPWRMNGQTPILEGKTSTRIVQFKGGFAVEKARGEKWQKVSPYPLALGPAVKLAEFNYRQ